MAIILVPQKPAAPKKTLGDYVLEAFKSLLTCAAGLFVMFLIVGLLIEFGIIGK